MALTSSDKIGLGQIGLQAATGLIGGMDNSDEEMRAKDLAQLRDDELFQLLLQSVANQGNVEQGIGQQQLQRSQAFSGANPLGAEMALRQNNATKRAGIEALGGRQLAGGQSNLAAGFMDRPGVREAYSDDAVNQAIQQRRIATAGLDPRAAREIGGTNGFASQLFNDQQASDQSQRGTAAQGFDMIRNRMAEQQAAAQEQPEEKDGGGFWKKFAKIAIPVGAAVAAPFTGGGSLGLMALGAGAGAATGALDGGWKGAGIGAGIGGASGLAASKLGVGRKPNLPVGPEAPGNGGMLGTYESAFPSSNPVGGAGFEQNSDILGSFPPINRSALAGPPRKPAPAAAPAQPRVNLSGFAPNRFNDPMDAATGRTPNWMSSFNVGQQTQMPSYVPPPAPDAGRFSDAKIGGYGAAPMNLQAGVDFGKTAGPGMNTAPLGAGLGAAGLLGAFGTGALATASAPQAQARIPQLMQLVQRSNAAMQAGRPVVAAQNAAAQATRAAEAAKNSRVAEMVQTILRSQQMKQTPPTADLSKIVAQMPKTNGQILSKLSPSQQLQMLQSGVRP